MKRLTAVFVCALLLTAAACADVIPDDTVNYEISSYVMRMTLEKNGDVRVRDEIIYNNPGSYDGYAHRVNLDGAQGIGDIAVWTDGEALSQTSEGEEAGFEAAIADGEAVIEIRAPGDSDWRTFVIEYTLTGLARRGEDAGVFRRALVLPGRPVRYHNTAFVIALPGPAAEARCWLDGTIEIENQIAEYDTIAIEPVDMGVDDWLEMELLFPADWIADADLSPTAPKWAEVEQPHTQHEEHVEQEKATFRAQQYAAIGVYVLLCLLALWLLRKRYGFVRKKLPQGNAEAAPACDPALIGCIAQGEANAHTLGATLSQMCLDGALTLTGEGETAAFVLTDNGAKLQPVQKAAADMVASLGDGAPLSALKAGTYQQGQAREKLYTAYKNAVTDAVRREGLVWQNESTLIAVNAACLILGFALMSVLLFIGKTLLWEAILAFAFMMFMLRQYDRVRRLTDKGEAWLAAASARADAAVSDASARSDVLPLAVALGVKPPEDWPELNAWQSVVDRIREAHYHNASMRRPKKRSRA
ncbi:MAG: DUF2207 domain-containing protein [Clostridia bacterium]|nr:DUF2207 domain-containing protein [Clostridia bacterium]